MSVALSLLLAVGASGVTWILHRYNFKKHLQRLREVIRTRETLPELSDWTVTSGKHWDELESEILRLKRDLRRSNEFAARESRDADSIMAAISDAIVAVDARGRVLFYNSQFALWFGRSSDRPETLISLSDWIRDPAALGAFENVASGTVEFSFTSETDRVLRDVSLSVRPLSRDSVLGVFHDVSGLKQAERMRIDFVANVSHEIKTPLTAIKGFTETMVEDLVALVPANSTLAPVLDAAQRVQRNADRLMVLVRDLLELSSLEQAGESGAIQKVLVSTRELTAQVISRVNTRVGNNLRHIEVEVDATEVLADPFRLEQVLTNLLDNALKYAPLDAAVGVRWKPMDKKAPGVRLVVWDRGPGISAEHQARLFERFYRVDRARSRSLGGTGLGLAIVKHIVQLHGGQVRVESLPGQGAIFTCDFPE